MTRYTVVSVTNKDGSASNSVGVEYVGKTVLTHDLKDVAGGSAILFDENDERGKHLRTSTVSEVTCKDDDTVVLVTRNTVYTLKRVPFRTASQTGLHAID